MKVSLPSFLRTRIALPTSKSISARALILNALSTQPSTLHGLSDCDDTRAVVAALRDNPEVVDIGAAGTAMRFLTAYYATREGETHVMTGTARMQQRPIGILVEALRKLGADISYEREEGYPPLRIRGRKLQGGAVTLPAHVSSQYISALLIIAPTLEKGLQLTLDGEIASAPYLSMTLALMREFGATATWEGAQMDIPSGAYHRSTDYAVEPDWSAASYWYELVALSSDPEARVLLKGLPEASVQGDKACAELFRPLGVQTEFTTEGAVLTKTASSLEGEYRADFANTPDLAQAVVVACGMLGQPFCFEGLKSLKIKETDRIAALTNELEKYGIRLHEPAEGELALRTEDIQPIAADTPLSIATYEDHRMAMAFAPTALHFEKVNIEHPEVVSKSYPNFWEDLLSVES